MKTIRSIGYIRKSAGPLILVAALMFAASRSDAADPPAESPGSGDPQRPSAKSDSARPGASEVTTDHVLGMRLRQSRHGEVLVVEVRHNGPAFRDGIRPGDQILSMNGANISSLADFNGALRRHDKTGKWQIVVKPTTQPRYINISLADRPVAGSPSSHPAMMGVTLNVEGGHLIVAQLYAGSPAEAAGVKSGDVLEAINGKAVANDNDVARILARHKAGDRVDLTIERNGWRRQFELPLARASAVAGLPLETESPVLRGQGPVVKDVSDDDWLDADEYEDISDPYLRARYTDFDG